MEVDNRNDGESVDGSMEDDGTTSDHDDTPYLDDHPSASNKAYVWDENYKEPDAAPVDDEYSADNEIQDNADADDQLPFVPPSQREDAPLAAILNPRLDEVDPRFESEIWWPSKSFLWRNLSAEERKRHHEAQNAKNEAIQRGELRQTSSLHQLNICEPPFNQDEYQMDQELLLLRPINEQPKDRGKKKNDEEETEIAPWRLGPAKSLYDSLNVPMTATGVNYGLKHTEQAKKKKKPDRQLSAHEATQFLPVNLMKWEDDIVMDDDQVRKELADSLKSGKQPLGGWFPTQHTRTFESFMMALKQNYLPTLFSTNPAQPKTLLQDIDLITEPTPTHSIYPLEFTEQLSTPWEQDIIIDPSAMQKPPEPKIFTLDINDDPSIFGMPDDYDAGDGGSNGFDKKDNAFTKKSKMILNQVQQRQKQEEDEQLESQMLRNSDVDPFNLSRDAYYMPKNSAKTGPNLSAAQLLHSIPAQNLYRPFFPTHLGISKLRRWHRPHLNRRIVRNVGSQFTAIQPLTDHIRQMGEMRKLRRQADCGVETFAMREVKDLSGRDGDLFLLEYAEEHPPLLSQPGMASRLRNYYKRKTGKEAEPDFEYGETAFTHNIPFLGVLQPGQGLQSIENHLFRAPIYRHQSRRNDYLLIHQNASWHIRRLPPTFVVGQLCPLYEVPNPNSKASNQFVRDSLLANIYRLFWQSNEEPRRLKMEDLRAAYPHFNEGTLRKRLKACSEFRRTGPGPENTCWILRPDFRLPPKEEVMALVTPEMCCAQYSMLAAEQRLKDAGYGERYFFTPENDDDSNDEVTLEDEIKAAPWNTTRAFLSALRGKCLLDQTGVADPTGCGLGFSYVRVSTKPPKEEGPTVPKKIGHWHERRSAQISALTRWEIIDVIRTLSTQAAKVSGTGENKEMSGMARFARGNIRVNMADLQEKGKKHSQRIFDLQNAALGNPDELSTDEGSGDDHSDNEFMAAKLETMMRDAKNRTNKELDEQRKQFEEEEKELQDLRKMMLQSDGEAKKMSAEDAAAKEKNVVARMGEELVESASKLGGITGNKKLKIYRTLRDEDGNVTVRTEVVTRPQLVEAYLQIRSTRNDDFIKVFAHMDEQFKEERRKERRRLQDQLRRLKRHQTDVKVLPKKEKPNKANLKVRCSACNQTGHMKTNRNCPYFGRSTPPPKFPTDDEASMSGADVSLPGYSGESLVEMDGTKIRIKKGLFPEKKIKTEDSSHLDTSMSLDQFALTDGYESSDGEMSRSSMKWGGKRRPSSAIIDETDYLQGPIKNIQRSRGDPKITMGTLLSEIVNELRQVPGSEPLLKPVNAKLVTDYYQLVKNPMDLQQIKQKIQDNKYELRMDFLGDVKRILDNSILYNGINHNITMIAQKMFEIAGKRVVEKEHRLLQLEKQINPLLDDNDRVGFSYILNEIVEKLRNIPKSGPFHAAVDAKKVPRYYLTVKRPMDLGKIQAKAKAHKYVLVKQFIEDLELLHANSKAFNGEHSVYTLKADELVKMGQHLLDEKAEQLRELEYSIHSDGLVTVDEEEMDDDAFEDEMMSPGGIEGPAGDMHAAADPDASNSNMDAYMDEDSQNPSSGQQPTTSGARLVEYDDYEDTMDAPQLDEEEITRRLLASEMHSAGQLNADLELSDSSEDESLAGAKRPRFEEDDPTEF
ncbi:unnamed protein product, partial [Mesorhabditis spiculigera]